MKKEQQEHDDNEEEWTGRTIRRMDKKEWIKKNIKTNKRRNKETFGSWRSRSQSSQFSHVVGRMWWRDKRVLWRNLEQYQQERNKSWRQDSTKRQSGRYPSNILPSCTSCNIKRTHPKVCHPFRKNPCFPAIFLPGFHWLMEFAAPGDSWLCNPRSVSMRCAAHTTPPLMGGDAFYSHRQCT